MYPKNILTTLVLSVAVFALLILSSGSVKADGQITITTFPKDLQLYPRDLQSNTATVTIEGSTTGSSTALVEVWRAEELVQTLEDPDGGAFIFSAEILAELQSYTIIAYHVDNGVETEVIRAENIAAGDVYIINGQSNATAKSYTGLANPTEQNGFIRSFGTSAQTAPALLADDETWYVADGDTSNQSGSIGQWALRMGNLLVENHGIPIAIINGGLEGKEIAYFAPNAVDSADLNTNYGRLQYRLDKAGLRDNIRALFWYQGENDTGDAETHITGFDALYANWQQDYPSIEQYYVFQIADWCIEALAIDLRNEQRLLGHRYDDISVVSTNGLTGHREDCHYNWEDGYQALGERVYRMVASDFYGASALDVAAPDADLIYFSNADKSEITIQLREPQNDILIGSEALFRFYLETEPATNFDGSPQWVAPDKLVLGLSRAVTSTAVLEFYGDAFFQPENSEDDIVNSTGHGMLAFTVAVDDTFVPEVSTAVSAETTTSAVQVAQVEAVDSDDAIVNTQVTNQVADEVTNEAVDTGEVVESDSAETAAEVETVSEPVLPVPTATPEPVAESSLTYNESANQYAFMVTLPTNTDDISLSRINLLDATNGLVAAIDSPGFSKPFLFSADMFEEGQSYTVELMAVDSDGELVETAAGETILVTNSFTYQPTTTTSSMAEAPTAETTTTNAPTSESSIVDEPAAAESIVEQAQADPMSAPTVLIQNLALDEAGENLLVSAETTNPESVGRYNIEIINRLTNNLATSVDHDFIAESTAIVPLSSYTDGDYEISLAALTEDGAVIVSDERTFTYNAPVVPDAAPTAQTITPTMWMLILIPLAIILLAILGVIGLLIRSILARRYEDDDYEEDFDYDQYSPIAAPSRYEATYRDESDSRIDHAAYGAPINQGHIEARPLVLNVINTLDPRMQGMSFPIDTMPFLLGRENCELTVRNDPKISRRHAKITVDNGQYFILDLNSANGVFVEEQRIPSHLPTPIRVGTQIRLGESTVLTVADGVYEPAY